MNCNVTEFHVIKEWPQCWPPGCEERIWLNTYVCRMRVVLVLFSLVAAQNDEIDFWDDSPGFLKRSHSLISPFSGNLPLWELKGDSMATAEYIRLTNDQQSKNGAIWSRVVRFWPIYFDQYICKIVYNSFNVLFSPYRFHGGKCNFHTEFTVLANLWQPTVWVFSWSKVRFFT